MKQEIPPWFEALMRHCRSLCLDSEVDRLVLWRNLSEAWPHIAIEVMISDNISRIHPDEDIEAVVARVKTAVISALDES